MTEPEGNVKDNSTEEKLTSKIKNEWMIRRCTVYDDEYSDCVSFKARFNQYFVFGKTLDCQQWKKDSVNCYKWVESKDVKAAEELIQSEKQRRKDRLLPHYQNDIWEKRKQPPPDWNKPLPEYMLQEYETSYLNRKAKELRGEMPPSFDANLGFCSIL